jgi:ribosomal protein S18 acetylase RimI-like enzyme
MRPSDVADAASVQEKFLEGSVITALGAMFLRQFHRAALGHTATCAHVALDGDDVVGLVVGSSDVHAFNQHVRPRVLAPLVPALLPIRRWPLVWTLLRSLREVEPQPVIPAELLLLVVDRRVRRQKVGQRLLAAFEADLRSARASRYRVAVRSELAEARRFYEASGFEREQELAILGRPMTYLTKRIAVS